RRALGGRRLGHLPELRLVGLLGILWRVRGGTRTDSGGATAVDHHHRARDVDAARVDVDEVAAYLHGELYARLDDHVHASLQVDLHASVEGVIVANLLVLIQPDVERDGTIHLTVLITLHVVMAVAFDEYELVLLD